MEPPCHKKNKGGYLLIDVSSMLFHIVFTLINLFDQKHKSSLPEPEEKRLYILKHFRRCFMHKIRTLVAVYQTTKLVFARDVHKHEIWRNKIFDKYKTQRKTITKHKGCSVSLGDYFSSIYRYLYDNLVIDLDAITVKIPEAEADDVIGVLTHYLTFQEERVVIVSDDCDFYPLLHRPSVEAYDTHGENFLKKFRNITPLGYMRLKILCGDKSDNIPGCQMLVDQFGILKKRHITIDEAQMFLKLGIFKIGHMDHKYAMRLQANPGIIVELRESDPLFNQHYTRNTTLIDMHHIPDPIRQAIVIAFCNGGTPHVPTLKEDAS